MGSEHYVNILSFVDKEQLEPGCAVLLNHKTHAVIGVLSDDADPMVSVMKLEKAPQVNLEILIKSQFLRIIFSVLLQSET